MEIDIKKDYYAVLGVSPFATQEEIKGAYRRLARRYHPDSREAETATGLFHAVHEAYAVLSDSVDRSAYDRQRDEQEIEETLPFTWDLSQSPTILSAASEEQTLHVLLKLRPEVGASRERLPLDLAMVIDRSTSMKGPRLAGVKEAAHQIVDQLGDDDFLTIVSFNDRPDVLVSDQVGSSRARAKTAITSLRAEGGTELLTGLEAGLQQLWGYRGRNAVSHLILLTDGRTYGDDEACVAAAASAGDRDIGITAMGIGEDWNDDLLDEMAARSGGTSDYISSSGQVYPLLQAVIRRLSSVFATELMLGIRVAEGVSIEGVFQTKPSVERLHTPEGVARLAPLGVDGARRVLIQAAVMGRMPGDHRLMQVDLYGDIPSLERRGERVIRGVWCRFVDQEPNQSDTEIPADIMGAVAVTTLFRMQERAWSALAEGRVDQATQVLENVAAQLLEMGEERLARAALIEAQHIAEKGRPTERGRKEIKYGTRHLGSRRERLD